MAIARQVGGSVENFVQMMNDKAASLAMTGTHFANPHGLHDENHYTTAYDVYLMLYAAYQHTEFQNTMSMSSYTLNDLFKLHGQISDRREKRTGKRDGARRKNRNDR